MVILVEPPDFEIYYVKIGSIDGSSSIGMFSNKTHLPNYTDNSIVFIKAGSFAFKTSRPSECSLPIFFMYLFA